MRRWQPLAIVALVIALVGAVAWALVERSARRRAIEDFVLQTINHSDRDHRQGRQLLHMEQRLDDLSNKLQAMEKWRNEAQEKLAAAVLAPGRHLQDDGRFPEIGRFMPRPDGGMGLAGRGAQRFSVKTKDGRQVSVSLSGAAQVNEELARNLGIDAEKRKKVNELIRKSNERYARELAAKGEAAGPGRLNFGLGAEDDGWVDFVNGGEMKKLLGEEAREKLLARFPRRSTMHMVTTGPGARVFMRRFAPPRGPDRPAEPARPGQPPPPAEEF